MSSTPPVVKLYLLKLPQMNNLEQAVNELRTLRDMVRWGASCFNAAKLYFGHGLDNAWDEAVFLARHVLHLNPEDEAHAADAALLRQEREQIALLYQRRILERTPAAYLTGEAWFAGLPFYVDERVIIPRSPLAELIEEKFSPWLNDVPVSRILDLCTGSGCIAIACAYAFPEAVVDAVDISESALAVANSNVLRHGLADSVQLHLSDLWDNLPVDRYDLIISNPPYVDAQDMAALPPEFHHEPTLALAAGQDGLAIVMRILAKALNYLTPQGILVVEVGNSGAALQARFSDWPFFWCEFQRGGHGVFVLTAEQLEKFLLPLWEKVPKADEG